ncbi:hypothetical protein JW835_10065 [bacterium]|nr:hypothetical protein [bacterium]
MQHKVKQILWVIGCMVSVSAYAGSHFQDRAGIAFRGGYWHQQGEDDMIRVNSQEIATSQVNVDGVGGFLTFFSGSGERGHITFTLGSIVHVHVVEEGLFSEQVDVQVISPVLFGYAYSLISDRNTSPFLPYVSAGGGPYVITHVHKIQYSLMDDEVTVNNRIKAGAFVGAGNYFLLTDWLAFHVEMRYHFINFNPENNLSGFEIGMGLAFSWRR